MSKSPFASPAASKKQIVMKKFRIQQTGIDPKTGKNRPDEVEVEGVDAFAALGKHRGRGVNGLGKGWQLTRQPDGWIVAVNRSQKVLEGGYHRMKEVDWTRNGDQSI
jgi:hypothetical protein